MAQSLSSLVLLGESEYRIDGLRGLWSHLPQKPEIPGRYFFLLPDNASEPFCIRSRRDRGEMTLPCLEPRMLQITFGIGVPCNLVVLRAPGGDCGNEISVYLRLGMTKECFM